MAGTFEFYEDASARIRFRQKAGIGQLNAASEDDTTRAAAKNGIGSVQMHAFDSALVDVVE
ncbi:DUF1508 domain-containing protein [Agromyces badenianii]|uniref:DUF1508 domain-containing protein n=1 Tax=Agromyces badenianii TaxID=2080742 RepID=A0A2S0WXL3_9MICO|nr:DUF1508 domain-containing protein [Agromyces badenianii]AWB96097.1 DUF1508 domain-containing protein [Agromyces badenianii]PWC04959.1 DUF1508 domain-containing protein [Agromyces badenianii]